MKRTKYSDVDSPFIRKRIAETRWEDRGIIDDLITLYWWVRRAPTTASSARAYVMLRKRLHDEWVTLFREYSKEAYARWLQESERIARNHDRLRMRYEAAARAEEQAELEDWIRVGGRRPEET